MPMDMGFYLSSACPEGTVASNMSGHQETHVLSHRCLKGSSGLQIWSEGMVLRVLPLRVWGQMLNKFIRMLRLVQRRYKGGQPAKSTQFITLTIYRMSDSRH